MNRLATFALVLAGVGVGVAVGAAGAANARPSSPGAAAVAEARAVSVFNCVVAASADGDWCGPSVPVAPGRSLTVSLDSSGGYKAAFIGYDGNGNRLGSSGTVHPGAVNRVIWTNHTRDTITVRVWADVEPHWVSVRLKGTYGS